MQSKKKAIYKTSKKSSGKSGQNLVFKSKQAKPQRQLQQQQVTYQSPILRKRESRLSAGSPTYRNDMDEALVPSFNDDLLNSTEGLSLTPGLGLGSISGGLGSGLGLGLEKADSDLAAKLLEFYNDMKTNSENSELPTRYLHLRRLSLLIIKEHHQMYRYPILQFIEETAKIMLMNDIEILYWYQLMKKYLNAVKRECQLQCEQVRIFFFLTAMFAKTFLVKSQAKKTRRQGDMEQISIQIRSIEAYLKCYHYSNFDKAYQLFDKDTLVLLDQSYLRDPTVDLDEIKKNYELHSCISKMKIRDLQQLFVQIRKPFEIDHKSNIIDYNWHVDGILKNSQSYNKLALDRKQGGADNQTAQIIEMSDFIDVYPASITTPYFNMKIQSKVTDETPPMKQQNYENLHPKQGYQSIDTQLTYDYKHPLESPLTKDHSHATINPSFQQQSLNIQLPSIKDSQKQKQGQAASQQQQNNGLGILNPNYNLFTQTLAQNNFLQNQGLREVLSQAPQLDLGFHDQKSSPDSLQRNSSIISSKQYNLPTLQKQTTQDQLQNFLKSQQQQNQQQQSAVQTPSATSLQQMPRQPSLGLSSGFIQNFNPAFLQRIPSLTTFNTGHNLQMRFNDKENDFQPSFSSSFGDRFSLIGNHDGRQMPSMSQLNHHANSFTQQQQALQHQLQQQYQQQQQHQQQQTSQQPLRDLNKLQNLSNMQILEDFDIPPLPDLNLEKMKSASDFLAMQGVPSGLQYSNSLENLHKIESNSNESANRINKEFMPIFGLQNSDWNKQINQSQQSGQEQPKDQGKNEADEMTLD
eukprot:403330818